MTTTRTNDNLEKERAPRLPSGPPSRLVPGQHLTSLLLALVASALLGCELDGEVPIGDTSAAVGASPVNLALGMPAIQSSTRSAGGDAMRAVDGNTDGVFSSESVTHTETEYQPWWQVDLQRSQSVGDVVLFNRMDCCADRLSDFTLQVSNDGLDWQSFAYSGTAPAQLAIAVNRTARFVRVQLNGSNPLSLAEVQVFSGDGNLAQGMPASQSSIAAGGDAMRAVDGNTDGWYHNGSVSHTATEYQPWWQVDLQSSQSIGDVVLYNRTDCCADRLSNFTLQVSKDGTNWQSFAYPGTAPAQLTFAVNQTARFVKVQLQGTNPLSLTEVQVFAPDSAAAQLLTETSTDNCNLNVAINNAVGQSFRVPSAATLDRMELWMKPELYYNTSYQVRLYDGDGTGGTLLATSASLDLGSLTDGELTGWHSFPFGPLVDLQANHTYTLQLTRLSQYSGAFALCQNVYPDGQLHWLGSYPQPHEDMAFRVFGVVP